MKRNLINILASASLMFVGCEASYYTRDEPLLSKKDCKILLEEEFLRDYKLKDSGYILFLVDSSNCLIGYISKNGEFLRDENGKPFVIGMYKYKEGVD